MLYFLKRIPKTRRISLAVLCGLSVVAALLFRVSNIVRLGCSVTGFRHDCRILLEETTEKEVKPELLPLLENPKEESFTYLRKLPREENKLKQR